MTDSEQRIFIGELAKIVNRRVGTIRRWVTSGKLPEHLQPQRNPSISSWRWWTPEQVQGIKEWMRDERVYPGSGLPNFNPDEEQIEALLQNRRLPRARA
jgi:hypothetical protein